MMKLKEVATILEAQEIYLGNFHEKEVSLVCACDLMSDVLTYIKPDTLLITGLINPQVIRTAEVAEIAAVCFVRGKKPGKEAVDLAQKKEIPLLASHLSTFEACGRLYSKGLVGCQGNR
jgi:predicted transcriptional regulator